MVPGTKRKHGATESDPLLRFPTDPPVKRDLLQIAYPCVQTLRKHLLSRLPAASRLRRKKIVTLGSAEGCSESETQVAKVLDTTLVCARAVIEDESASATRWQQWLSFSQKGDESYVTISDAREAASSQSEVCPRPASVRTTLR